MAASGEKLARPAAPSDSLMRLGSVRDVVLARVPIEAHRALAQTCKALRRLVYSDDFAKLRKTLGFEEYGLLLLAGRIYEDGGAMVERGKQFVCLTHNLESLGFAAQTDCPLDLDEFTTALSTEGRLFVCGDANHDRKLLIYDTRKHEWVRDPRYPASIPVVMYGQCTAFLDNTLVVVAGGTNAVARPWGFSWDEQLRMWQSLPPLPTAATHPCYGVIGSRLFVVGGYTKDKTHPEHYGGGRMSSYSTRLQIFDATKRTWSLGPPLDALRDRLERPMTAAVHNGPRASSRSTSNNRSRSNHTKPQATANRWPRSTKTWGRCRRSTSATRSWTARTWRTRAWTRGSCARPAAPSRRSWARLGPSPS